MRTRLAALCMNHRASALPVEERVAKGRVRGWSCDSIRDILRRNLFRTFLLPLLLAAALGTSGCSTTKVDWNGRVGNFTSDQAVLELGPPDKSAKLTDGTLVDEWLISRGARYGTVYNLSPFWWGGQVDMSQGPDFFLRLTFGPDGKLRSWKRVAR